MTPVAISSISPLFVTPTWRYQERGALSLFLSHTRTHVHTHTNAHPHTHTRVSPLADIFTDKKWSGHFFSNIQFSSSAASARWSTATATDDLNLGLVEKCSGQKFLKRTRVEMIDWFEKKHRSFSTNERRKSWPASFRGGWHFDWEVFFRYSASI